MYNRHPKLFPLIAVLAIACGDGDGVTAGTGGTGGEADPWGATGGVAAFGGVGATGGTGSVGVAGEAGGTGDPCDECQVLEECEGTRCVAEQVSLPGGFSIDATEVTRAQYEQWLATNPPVSDQPIFCEWNTSFTPQCDWAPELRDGRPVVCVDWCDASAYCKGLGRRLCGKIGGGSADYDEPNDPTSSQWFAACSAGGQNKYPYGDYPVVGMCQHRFSGGQYAAPVGSRTKCQSSVPEYAGVYDLSGNVWEWEDACSGYDQDSNNCLLRGGGFIQYSFVEACDNPTSASRDRSRSDFGFRCCSAP